MLARNGSAPRAHSAIGRPLPISQVRISLGSRGRWIDTPIDHLPTADELAAALAGALEEIAEWKRGEPSRVMTFEE